MINDVFIYHKSGLPFVARCYGGDMCKADNNHTLLTGFFAAMNSFTSEFGQTIMKRVDFDQISLIFYNNDEVFVSFSVSTEDITKYEPYLQEVLDEFVSRYPYVNSSNGMFDISDHDEFTNVLDGKFRAGMGDLRPVLIKRRSSFWKRVKKLFR